MFSSGKIFKKIAVKNNLILKLVFTFIISFQFSVLAENSFNAPDPKVLRTSVEKIVNMFPLRDHEHPQELYRLAQYIKKELSSNLAKSNNNIFDTNIEMQSFKVNKNDYYNVIARMGSPIKKRIVVGAHYDTAGPFPGADDNTSGVVGLIELSKLLRNVKLKNSIELVAYSLEEPPYFATSQMGSAVHAKSLKEEKIEVLAMISLEMIGFFSDKPNSQEFPTEQLRAVYPSIGNFISVVGKIGEESLTLCISNSMRKQYGLSVYHLNGPIEMKGVGFSDHLSYWRNDFPAVMITDTAFFRNKNYHTAKDLPETLDYSQMSKVILGVLRAIIAIDSGCK